MRGRAVILSVLAAIAASTAPLGAPAASAARCPRYDAPSVSGDISDPRINEVSGVVVSRTLRRVLWIEEDSGNGPWVYAVSPKGRMRDAIEVTNAVNLDWEDIANAMGRLWIGDIGDNARARDFITVYRFAEPRSLDTTSVHAASITLRYPRDVAHNAEAMIVDGRSQRLFVFEKLRDVSSSRVFAVDLDGVRSGDDLRLRRVARVPIQNVTAADLGNAGIVVKNYTQALFFPWKGRSPVATLRQDHPCPLTLPSSESVALSRRGDRIYSIPEGSDPDISHVDRVGG